ncbi:MAG: LysM peptidoglycan-binding domain-containing protein [Elusimicrobia bacterium]|nr:LysM peptidoglycan-binding domain-containing protein [Elusimicrobiota bacterium]
MSFNLKSFFLPSHQRSISPRTNGQSISIRVCWCAGLLVICYFLLVTFVYAKQKPKTYRVWIWQENGDCLWNIAKKFYGDGRKWVIIYEANKDEIADPGKIYPKQKLIIP